MELVLQGLQGKTVSVSGDSIKFEKKGFLSAKREKTLPIRNVMSVEVKKPGAIASGFLQFSIAGGKARDSSFTLTGGAFDAAKDENSIVFTGGDKYETALKIKAYVEECRKLKALMDEGIITAEAFEKKKKQLLGL
jgi:hypothetical protein